MLTRILLFLRQTNSGKRGVWVYNIGSSSFTDIIPGHVTIVKEDVLPLEATENAETIYSGRGEFTEDPLYLVEKTPPERSPPESILLSRSSNPHEEYPIPRGPRPVNPQVVVLDEQDETINVNGKMLTVMPNASNTAVY